MPENIEITISDINNSFTNNYVSWPIPGDRNYATVTTSTIKNFLSRIYYLYNNLQNVSNQLNNHQHGWDSITGGPLPYNKGGIGLIPTNLQGNFFIKIKQDGNGYEFISSIDVRTNISAADVNHTHNNWDQITDPGALPINRGGTGTTSAAADYFVRVANDGNSYEFIDPANVNSIISAADVNHTHNNWDQITDPGALPINRGGTGTTSAAADYFVRVANDGNSYTFVDPENIVSIIGAASASHSHTWGEINYPDPLPVDRGGIGSVPTTSQISYVVCVTADNSPPSPDDVKYTFVDVNTLITNNGGGSGGGNYISENGYAAFYSTTHLSKSNYPGTNPNNIIKSIIKIGNNKDVVGSVNDGNILVYEKMEYPENKTSNFNGGWGWESEWSIFHNGGSVITESGGVSCTNSKGSVKLSLNNNAVIIRTIADGLINFWGCMFIKTAGNGWSSIKFLRNSPNSDAAFSIEGMNNYAQAKTYEENETTPHDSEDISSVNVFAGNVWKALIFNYNFNEQKLNIYLVNENNFSNISNLTIEDFKICELNIFNFSSYKEIKSIVIYTGGELSIDEIMMATSYKGLWTNIDNIATGDSKLMQISFRDSSNGIQHGSIEVHADDKIENESGEQYNFRIVGPVNKKGKINFILHNGNQYTTVANISNKLNLDSVVASQLQIGRYNTNQQNPFENPGLINIVPIDNLSNISGSIDNNTIFIAIINNEPKLCIKLNGNIYQINLTSL